MGITSIVAFLLAGFVWTRRILPGGRYFALLMFAMGEWTLTAVLEMAASDLSAKIAFGKLSYFAVVSLGLLFFSFALDYCGKRTWIAGKRELALWVFPAIVLVLAFTNEWHGLIWPSVTLAGAPERLAVYTHGPVFFLFTAYAYSLAIAGILVLAGTALRTTAARRMQIVSVLAGAAVVIAGNLLHIFDVRPLGDLDLYPFLLLIAAVFGSWRIFGNHLFDIRPLARERLIADMTDGILVVDNEDIVVEINPAASRLIGGHSAIGGRPLAEVLAEAPALRKAMSDRQETPVEVPVGPGDSIRWLDVRASRLGDRRGKPSGWLIVLRDVTGRKRIEEDLRMAYGRLLLSNEALQNEIDDRRKAEEQALVMLREKEVLLKEIHHRVKNNLQIISSLLSLQSEGSGGEESVAKKFRDSQDRIRSMALIHEKLYRSKDLSHIDFAEYVGSLTAYLYRTYATGGNVSLALDIRDVWLDIDVAIPCGLIINELTSNAFKYAFPDQRPGTISISLMRSDDRYVLKVGDDGQGLPPGLDFRNTLSLGLMLVSSLVEQLDGTIALDCVAGTCFTITFSGSRK
jgi:PAS domain S-box-containing protein